MALCLFCCADKTADAPGHDMALCIAPDLSFRVPPAPPAPAAVAAQPPPDATPNALMAFYNITKAHNREWRAAKGLPSLTELSRSELGAACKVCSAAWATMDPPITTKVAAGAHYTDCCTRSIVAWHVASLVAPVVPRKVEPAGALIAARRILQLIDIFRSQSPDSDAWPLSNHIQLAAAAFPVHSFHSIDNFPQVVPITVILSKAAIASVLDAVSTLEVNADMLDTPIPQPVTVPAVVAVAGPAAVGAVPFGGPGLQPPPPLHAGAPDAAANIVQRLATVEAAIVAQAGQRGGPLGTASEPLSFVELIPAADISFGPPTDEPWVCLKGPGNYAAQFVGHRNAALRRVRYKLTSNAPADGVLTARLSHLIDIRLLGDPTAISTVMERVNTAHFASITAVRDFVSTGFLKNLLSYASPDTNRAALSLADVHAILSNVLELYTDVLQSGTSVPPVNQLVTINTVLLDIWYRSLSSAGGTFNQSLSHAAVLTCIAAIDRGMVAWQSHAQTLLQADLRFRSQALTTVGTAITGCIPAGAIPLPPTEQYFMAPTHIDSYLLQEPQSLSRKSGSASKASGGAGGPSGSLKRSITVRDERVPSTLQVKTGDPTPDAILDALTHTADFSVIRNINNDPRLDAIRINGQRPCWRRMFFANTQSDCYGCDRSHARSVDGKLVADTTTADADRVLKEQRAQRGRGGFSRGRGGRGRY